jgi:hypothetical protein
MRQSMGVVYRIFRVPLAAVASLVYLGTAPASANTVALYCSWPNDIGFIVDIDYDKSQVAIKLNSASGFAPRPSPARITEYDVRWSASADPALVPSNFRINRISGELTACGGGPNSLNENFCNQPMKCVPRKPIL